MERSNFFEDSNKFNVAVFGFKQLFTLSVNEAVNFLINDGALEIQ
jgi:hypothetical protein